VTALVSVLTVLVVLMALLVAGRLRSHAEILRRLDGEGGEAGGADGGLARREDAPARARGEEAPDVVGTTLAGEPVQVGLGGTPALLAFLTTGCSVCGELWEGLRSPPALPDGMRVVVVAKDASHESPSRLARLAPPGVRVVLSSRTWELYRVPASPYFVHVGPTGLVEGEGVATTWDAVASLVADALLDAEAGNGGRVRQLRGEEALEAAGVGPGHPSLYGREDV
jgi:hypothetical protein